MRNKENEVLVYLVGRRRGARRISKGDANQLVKQAPNVPATQSNIAGVCQVLAQLIQQQQQT